MLIKSLDVELEQSGCVERSRRVYFFRLRQLCQFFVRPRLRADFTPPTVESKIRVNLHHGKIEDAVVRAVVQDGISKLQVDVVGFDLTALIDTRQVVDD